MAVTFVAVSTTGTLVAGTTTTAGTASCSPGLPVGTASGDRVYLLQSASNTSAAAPAGWNQLYKDVQVGVTGTVPGAGTGRRYISAWYRDYDGVWTMPARALTSATQNSNAAYGLTLRKGATDVWDTPTFTSPGHDTTNATTYSITTPSFTTIADAMLMSHAAHTGGAATASAQTMTQTGATFANLTERIDNGTATGNDVRIVVGTADVTVGATAAVTRTATLSAAATGGTALIQQTVTPPNPNEYLLGESSIGNNTTGSPHTLTTPAGMAVGDLVVLIQANNWYDLTALGTPTGTAVSTWTEQTIARYDGGNDAHHVKVWTGPAALAGARTVISNYAAGSGGDEERYSEIFVFPNAVFDTGSSQAQVSSTTYTLPSLVASAINSYLIGVVGNLVDTNFSFPAGMTPLTERDIGGITTYRSGYEFRTVTGATGTRSVGSSNAGAGFVTSLLIKPAAGAAPDLTKFFLANV